MTTTEPLDCPKCEGEGRIYDCPAWCTDLDHGGICPRCNGSGSLPPGRYCAICGEPAGSVYAKPCCIDDNMIEGNRVPPGRYCAACGEPEGSPYAKRCCTDDNMIEALP